MWIKSRFIFLNFPNKIINYAWQLFGNNGSIKKWLECKREYNLLESFYFQ